MSTQELALGYLRKGWSIIPLPAGSKRAVIRWSAYMHQRPTEDDVVRWFGNGKSHNMAIITGRLSGVVILDADGDEGQRSLAGKELPRTPCVQTDRGTHYYFKHPGGSVRNFAGRLPGLDFRGDGGYAVLPPSIHPSGRAYEWLISPDDMPLAEMPAWLNELVAN